MNTGFDTTSLGVAAVISMLLKLTLPKSASGGCGPGDTSCCSSIHGPMTDPRRSSYVLNQVLQGYILDEDEQSEAVGG